VVPGVLRGHLESAVQDSSAQVDRKQTHQQSILVHLDITVPWEALIRYLVAVAPTRMSSNRRHVRPAHKVFTVMEPFLMQLTVAMECSSQHPVSKVTTVQMELNLLANASVQLEPSITGRMEKASVTALIVQLASIVQEKGMRSGQMTVHVDFTVLVELIIHPLMMVSLE